MSSYHNWPRRGPGPTYILYARVVFSSHADSSARWVFLQNQLPMGSSVGGTQQQKEKKCPQLPDASHGAWVRWLAAGSPFPPLPFWLGSRKAGKIVGGPFRVSLTYPVLPAFWSPTFVDTPAGTRVTGMRLPGRTTCQISHPQSAGRALCKPS